MATMALPAGRIADDHRFFLGLATAMTLVLVAGFSMQLAMGRSTFGVPWYVHVHALVFFGWTFLYLVQNALVATGNVSLHRRLGWLGAGWAVAVLVVGTALTVQSVRVDRVPFFFTPAYFLIMNPMSVVVFAGLTFAGIRLRRATEWHRRLIACGMAELTGPGFGRLLPLPFVIPYAGWLVFAAVMLFPLAGLVHDLRTRGRVHPSWWWGIGAMAAAQALIAPLAASPVGLAIHAAATAGSPGARVAPLAYPPFPPMP